MSLKAIFVYLNLEASPEARAVRLSSINSCTLLVWSPKFGTTVSSELELIALRTVSLSLDPILLEILLLLPAYVNARFNYEGPVKLLGAGFSMWL